MFHISQIDTVLLTRSLPKAIFLLRRFSTSHALMARSTDIYTAHPTTVNLSTGDGKRFT